MFVAGSNRTQLLSVSDWKSNPVQRLSQYGCWWLGIFKVWFAILLCAR
jgi:hypothetical protein